MTVVVVVVVVAVVVEPAAEMDDNTFTAGDTDLMCAGEGLPTF